MSHNDWYCYCCEKKVREPFFNSQRGGYQGYCDECKHACYRGQWHDETPTPRTKEEAGGKGSMFKRPEVGVCCEQREDDYGSLPWPSRGYGPSIAKIYAEEDGTLWASNNEYCT